MERDPVGWLLAIGAGTLIVFFFVWAAMHDLAHGEEGTLEWTALVVCALVFPLLYRFALRTLPSREKVLWLAGTGLLTSLFGAGALSAIVQPKYVRDPMLASIFLAAGIPLLALTGYHLVRELSQRRLRRGT